MHSQAHDIEMLLQRIQSEFREMPGLRLTSAQAERLFGLEPHRCGSIMRALIDTGFLRRTRAGTYARADNAV